jgi:hypothetical protein
MCFSDGVVIHKIENVDGFTLVVIDILTNI